MALAERFPRAEFRWIDIEDEAEAPAAPAGEAYFLKTVAMVAWMRSAASRGSFASRIGRPTTM